jgi:hypothetical protein
MNYGYSGIYSQPVFRYFFARLGKTDIFSALICFVLMLSRGLGCAEPASLSRPALQGWLPKEMPVTAQGFRRSCFDHFAQRLSSARCGDQLAYEVLTERSQPATLFQGAVSSSPDFGGDNTKAVKTVSMVETGYCA